MPKVVKEGSTAGEMVKRQMSARAGQDGRVGPAGPAAPKGIQLNFHSRPDLSLQSFDASMPDSSCWLQPAEARPTFGQGTRGPSAPISPSIGRSITACICCGTSLTRLAGAADDTRAGMPRQRAALALRTPSIPRRLESRGPSWTVSATQRVTAV